VTREDEAYERLKQEIGWHCTWSDVAFICCMIALVWFTIAVAA